MGPEDTFERRSTPRSGWGKTLDSLSPVVRLIVFGSSIVFGLITAGMFLAAYRSLPAQVEQNHKQLDETAKLFRTMFDSLTTEIRGVKGELVELKKTNAIQLCLTRSEKEHTDWRKCFLPTP